jgi:hypothetical protein
MALGGEVHDGARAVLGQQLVHQRPVADVALHQRVTGIAAQGGQVLRVAGVGQGVQRHHRIALRLRRCEPIQHEIATDEAGAAGDEKGHGLAVRSACSRSISSLRASYSAVLRSR